MKKLKLTKKLIISLVIIILITAIATPAIVFYTPRSNGSCILNESCYKYRGKTYTFVTSYPNLYNKELDKWIAHTGGLFGGKDFHSLKNDPDCNFIYVSQFGEHCIYTCLPIKDEDIEKDDFQYKNIISYKQSENNK